jgi:hypothetical protein
MNEKWTHPQPVDDLDVVFPTNVSHLMPTWEEIPAEFKRYPSNNKWGKFVSDWFFFGLKDLKITPKKDIDSVLVMRHLKAIIGSFQTKHEHKEAALAYLASLWLDDVTYTLGPVD